MNACSVPIPPGEIGTSVARLWVTWTSRTFRSDCSTPKARGRTRSRRSGAASRRPASAATCCRYARPVGEHRETLADARLELGDVDAGPDDADHAEDRERDEHDGRELGVGSRRSRSRSPAGAERADAGQHAERQRVGEDQHRHRHVEDREHEQGRGERRVRAAGHGAVGEVEPDRVAGAGRDDRVDADAGEVGGVDRAPAHLLVGIRRGDRVPPRAARAHRLQTWAAIASASAGT